MSNLVCNEIHNVVAWVIMINGKDTHYLKEKVGGGRKGPPSNYIVTQIRQAGVGLDFSCPWRRGILAGKQCKEKKIPRKKFGY